jgi:hypothetical protein
VFFSNRERRKKGKKGKKRRSSGEEKAVLWQAKQCFNAIGDRLF